MLGLGEAGLSAVQEEPGGGGGGGGFSGVQRGDADANLLAAARRRRLGSAAARALLDAEVDGGQRAEPADVVGARPRDHARHAAEAARAEGAAISVPKTPGPMFWSRRATSA